MEARTVTIETIFRRTRHWPATAGVQKGITGRRGRQEFRRLVMYAQQKAKLRIILVAALALGSSASVLSGTLTALSLSA
jgi:hypothetical protein